MAPGLAKDDAISLMATCRTATLATLTPDGRARLVPICSVVIPGPDGRTWIYSPLDEKPKRGQDVRRLARVRDLSARPDVTVLFEHWSEDWSRLAWVRASGRARLLEPLDQEQTHHQAVRALRTKYPQYQEQAIDARPLIAIEIETVSSWSARSGPDQAD
jgi:PPOX class probable F420-dependent enzyme